MKNKKSYEVTKLQGKNGISPPPPPPSSKSTFVEYHQLIVEESQLHVEDSLNGKSMTVLWSSFCI